MKKKKLVVWVLMGLIIGLWLATADAKEIMLDSLEDVKFAPSGQVVAGMWGKNAGFVVSTEKASEGKKSGKFSWGPAIIGKTQIGGPDRYISSTWNTSWNGYTTFKMDVFCITPKHGKMMFLLGNYAPDEKNEKKWAPIMVWLLETDEVNIDWKELSVDLLPVDLSNVQYVSSYTIDSEGGFGTGDNWKEGQSITFYIDNLRLVTPDIKIEPLPSSGQTGEAVTISGNGFGAKVVIPSDSITIGNSPTTHQEMETDKKGTFDLKVALKNSLATGKYDIVIKDSSHKGQGLYTFPQAYEVK